MANRTCSIDGCERPHWGRGYCTLHHSRWKRYGVPTLPTAQDRFWAKVEKAADPDGCWIWTGATAHGYGSLTVNSQRCEAHRLAYEWLIGPIPAGLHIDHLCRNRACVNPDHLEPVTQRENILRGHSWPADQARKTHCKHGHAFTPENTYVTRAGHRQCKTCNRARQLALQRARGGRPGRDRWRRAVVKRDGNRCVRCGSRRSLHAHHIRPVATYPELQRDVDNGETLCMHCHHDAHSSAT